MGTVELISNSSNDRTWWQHGFYVLLDGSIKLYSNQDVLQEALVLQVPPLALSLSVGDACFPTIVSLTPSVTTPLPPQRYCSPSSYAMSASPSKDAAPRVEVNGDDEGVGEVRRTRQTVRRLKPIKPIKPIKPVEFKTTRSFALALLLSEPPPNPNPSARVTARRTALRRSLAPPAGPWPTRPTWGSGTWAGWT